MISKPIACPVSGSSELETIAQMTGLPVRCNQICDTLGAFRRQLLSHFLLAYGTQGPSSGQRQFGSGVPAQRELLF